MSEVPLYSEAVVENEMQEGAWDKVIEGPGEACVQTVSCFAVEG